MSAASLIKVMFRRVIWLKTRLMGLRSTAVMHTHRRVRRVIAKRETTNRPKKRLEMSKVAISRTKQSRF